MTRQTADSRNPLITGRRYKSYQRHKLNSNLLRSIKANWSRSIGEHFPCHSIKKLDSKTHYIETLNLHVSHNYLPRSTLDGGKMTVQHKTIASVLNMKRLGMWDRFLLVWLKTLRIILWQRWNLKTRRVVRLHSIQDDTLYWTFCLSQQLVLAVFSSSMNNLLEARERENVISTWSV